MTTIKLIDKDALVAWAKETYLCENASMIRKVCYKQLLEHLDTLEVKEMDLDKEIPFRWSWFCIHDKDRESFVKVAKHFFKLGLKAQKGEYLELMVFLVLLILILD